MRHFAAVASESNSVGTSIRDARLAAGLTQVELGERIGVRQQSVVKWEQGITKPSTSRLASIATALGVTADQLLGGESLRPEMSASGIDLDELRRVDPEMYAQIEQMARLALDRANERQGK